VADVEYEIEDLVAWAPESLTGQDRKAIPDELMAQTRLVTDPLRHLPSGTSPQPLYRLWRASREAMWSSIESGPGFADHHDECRQPARIPSSWTYCAASRA
jgi:hypothetical protein